MEKYLYFRKDSTLTNDDDPANGSVMYPLSAFQGLVVGDSSTAGAVTGDSVDSNITGIHAVDQIAAAD